MINLVDVTKYYNKNKNNEILAIDNINLTIEKNSFNILKGESGSGKSTLLALIAGIDRPDHGEIIVGDDRVSKLQDYFLSDYRYRKIGLIFQDYALIPYMTVADNLKIVFIGKKKNDINSIIADVLEKLHIYDKRDRLVSELSGGEKQRTAIARAIVNDPEVILADEPTSNLDSTLSEEFIEDMIRMVNYGKTVIIATHDQIFSKYEKDFNIINIFKGKLA